MGKVGGCGHILKSLQKLKHIWNLIKVTNPHFKQIAFFFI